MISTPGKHIPDFDISLDEKKNSEGSDSDSLDFGIWQDTQCCQAHQWMRLAAMSMTSVPYDEKL